MAAAAVRALMMLVVSSFAAGERTVRFAAAEAAASRALLIAPDHAFAHVAMSFVLGFTDRIEQAIAEFERALALDPNFAFAHAIIGMHKLHLDRGEPSPLHRSLTSRLSLGGWLISASRDRRHGDWPAVSDAMAPFSTILPRRSIKRRPALTRDLMRAYSATTHHASSSSTNPNRYGDRRCVACKASAFEKPRIGRAGRLGGIGRKRNGRWSRRGRPDVPTRLSTATIARNRRVYRGIYEGSSGWLRARAPTPLKDRTGAARCLRTNGRIHRP
jgi:hypothetical protein